jgi:hypothetical protein
MALSAADVEADRAATCCCCCSRNSNKVTPLTTADHPDSYYVEPRENCHIRVRHRNLVPRDEEFEVEMVRILYGSSKQSPHIKNNVPNKVKQTRGNAHKQHQESHNHSASSIEHPFSPENLSTDVSSVQKANQSGSANNSNTMANGNVYGHTNPTTTRMEDSVSSARQSSSYQRCRTATSVNINLGTPRKMMTETTINKETTATGNLPLLFFIHGVGGSSDVWKTQMDYFAKKGYEVVAPDLIGHGFSSAPNNHKAYKFEVIMKDIFLIFDTCCKRNNVIIGHSYG